MKWFIVNFLKLIGMVGGVAAFLYVLNGILMLARAAVKGG